MPKLYLQILERKLLLKHGSIKIKLKKCRGFSCVTFPGKFAIPFLKMGNKGFY